MAGAPRYFKDGSKYDGMDASLIGHYIGVFNMNIIGLPNFCTPRCTIYMRALTGDTTISRSAR